MDDGGTITLQPIGDVELWFAEPDDCTWRLPLHVEWKQEPASQALYGLVLPAVCFYQAQLLAMQAILHRHSLELRDDRWLIPEKLLRALLHKAPGIHAEFYYQWPDSHRPLPSPYHTLPLRPQPKPEPRRLEDYRDFAAYVAKERHLPEDVVLMVVTSITQLGARWMLEHRQVLNLGFVRLVALPFRINWKEIVAFKCRPWKVLDVLCWPKQKRDEELRKFKFPAIACSTHNIGIEGTRGFLHPIQYTIEAIPGTSFEKAIAELENEKLKAGRTSYVAHFEETVEVLYDEIVEAMAFYARKVRASWATVRSLGGSGVLAFLRVGRWVKKVRGVSLSDLPAHIVPPHSDFSVFAESERESDPHLVRAQTNEMQKVPAVSSGGFHLRKRKIGGDVDEPRPEGANGVPVLDAGEGPPPR